MKNLEKFDPTYRPKERVNLDNLEDEITRKLYNELSLSFFRVCVPVHDRLRTGVRNNLAIIRAVELRVL